MSDTENGTESILDVPHGGAFSLQLRTVDRDENQFKLKTYQQV